MSCELFAMSAFLNTCYLRIVIIVEVLKMFPVRLSSSTAVMLELERIFAWHITNEVSIPALARGFYHFETQPSKTVNIVSMIVLGV
jgi:hypothetical protein